MRGTVVGGRDSVNMPVSTRGDTRERERDPTPDSMTVVGFVDLIISCGSSRVGRGALAKIHRIANT